jgi:hypothetical protein
MTTPSDRPADPRAACVVVALLSARRQGVQVDVAELLDGMHPLDLFAGFIDVAEWLLSEGTEDGGAWLARLGLVAASRAHGRPDD